MRLIHQPGSCRSGLSASSRTDPHPPLPGRMLSLPPSFFAEVDRGRGIRLGVYKPCETTSPEEPSSISIRSLLFTTTLLSPASLVNLLSCAGRSWLIQRSHRNLYSYSTGSIILLSFLISFAPPISSTLTTHQHALLTRLRRRPFGFRLGSRRHH